MLDKFNGAELSNGVLAIEWPSAQSASRRVPHVPVAFTPIYPDPVGTG
jgi:hypothetical protein